MDDLNQQTTATAPNSAPLYTNHDQLSNSPVSANQQANQGMPPEKANPLTKPATDKTASAKTAPTKLLPTTGKSELLDAGAILTEILGLQTGQIVADLGAGGGMFSIQAARLVGEQGQVYAVDIIRNTLSDIDSKARLSGLYNIKTVWSNLEIVGAAQIPEASLDAAMLVNVLFQSDKHKEMLTETNRLLKPGGKLLVVDWSDTKPGFTPDSSRQVNPDNLINIARQLSFILERKFQAGQYHFGLLFVKQ